MKTSAPSLFYSLRHGLLECIRAWNRFWFTPRDPTLLGLVRIFGGLVALYTVVAYSYDLQEFFGKDAWFNLADRLVNVREMPTVVESLAGDPVRVPIPPEGAPNVLLVVLDDVGFAQLGCYGSDIETPFIDAVATDAALHVPYASGSATSL